jgi:hypothetical protein
MNAASSRWVGLAADLAAGDLRGMHDWRGCRGGACCAPWNLDSTRGLIREESAVRRPHL